MDNQYKSLSTEETLSLHSSRFQAHVGSLIISPAVEQSF